MAGCSRILCSGILRTFRIFRSLEHGTDAEPICVLRSAATSSVSAWAERLLRHTFCLSIPVLCKCGRTPANSGFSRYCARSRSSRGLRVCKRYIHMVSCILYEGVWFCFFFFFNQFLLYLISDPRLLVQHFSILISSLQHLKMHHMIPVMLKDSPLFF